MPHDLQHFFTEHVAVGFTEQRLAYLSEKIAAAKADFCVVLQAGSLRYVGMFRLAELADLPGGENKLLIELLSYDKFICAPADASIAAVSYVLNTRQEAVPVTDQSGAFLGLITKESYADSWLKRGDKKSDEQKAVNRKLPHDSNDRNRRVSSDEFMKDAGLLQKQNSEHVGGI